MSFLRLSAIALFALPLAAQDHYYTTSFPASENPICQAGTSGCVWINGGSTGLNWGNVQTTPGLVFGTNISGAPPFNDSIAALTGNWTGNQTAQATVNINATDSSSQEEVELHLNTSIAPNSITGYEFDASVIAGNPYLVIVRWNGALNSFCYINSGSTCGSPNLARVAIHNGDVLKATNINGALTFYVNGVAEITAKDLTFTGGSPGVGFWNVGGAIADLAHYGFSSFTAWDSVYSGQQPNNPTNLTGDAVAK